MNRKSEHWYKTTIGQLGRVVTGKTPPSSKPELFGDEYPFITPSDMEFDRVRIATERFLSSTGCDSQPSLLLPKSAVCFCCIGATIGKICMAACPSFSNQQINSVIVDSTRHHPYFVYSLLRTLRSEIAGVAGGAATPIVNKTSFSSLEVTVPELATQHKISFILSAYDDLIENNTRRIAILEEMAQSIYREWFVNFRFPGHEEVKLVDSPIGKIPEGWEPSRLGDLARENRRGVDPSQIDPETPYFGLEHLPRRSITLGDWGKATDVQSTKLAFKIGEILFGKIRPYFHKVGVAPVDGVCSSDAIVISPKTTLDFAPVLCCVSSDDFVRHATQTSQGTKMPRANWDVLVKYPCPKPGLNLLINFNKLVKDTVDELRLLMLKNRNLRLTRDLLLPKLISGQLDVEELDIDIGEMLAEANE